MKVALDGVTEVAAPPGVVWSRLADPSFVASCAPDVESVRDLGDGRSEAVASFGAGPVRVRFRIEATFEARTPGAAATVTMRGRAPGTEFRAALAIDLAAAAGGTRVTWKGTADVHGLLAAVGSRLVESAGRAAAAAFWSSFATRVAAST